MLNPKTHLPPAPCQQSDIDICAALMGKPLGETKVEDIQAAAIEAAAPPAIDLAPLLLLPTNKVAMKAWVKQVQSTVVQVGETVKVRAAETQVLVKKRMAVVSDQVKARMADTAIEAAKRVRKAG